LTLPAELTRFTARELRVLVALFVLTLPAVTARLYSSDEVQYYAYLRSLWFDRDVSFDNEYRTFYDRGIARTPGFEQTFLEPLTPTGHRENYATIGSAILWSPFFAVADVTTRLRRAIGSTVDADGYSRPYIVAVAYGSAIYGFAALVLAMSAARRLIGNGVGAGLAIWIGTPLLFYMYAAPPFSHACSAFAVALFVTIWLRVREDWTPGGMAALGAAAALMTMVREQDVFYVLGPAIDFAGDLVERYRRGRLVAFTTSVAALAAGVVTSAIVYLPQIVAYVALNGRFGPSRHVTRKMNWISPHAPGVLASPSHGLFAWTPLAILAVAGLVLLAMRSRADQTRLPLHEGVRHARRLGVALLVMVAFQVYVSGSVESWTVAGAFGQRRFVGATILFVIGLASFWSAIPGGLPRRVAAAAIGIAIWWNLGLMALFGAGLMDRQRLTLGRNAYDVFVTLPRSGPGLAYRYLFERETFYKTRDSSQVP
jgi:hypothetical protein